MFQVDKILTKDIPQMEVSWDPQMCMDKLFEVLREIKTRLPHDDEAIVIRIGGGFIDYEQEDAKKCTFVQQSFLNNFEID